MSLRWSGTLVFAGLVALAAVLTRLAMLGLAPIYDELYQMHPALSLIDEGTLRVLDGVYDRSSLFTAMIARSFEWFGETGPVTARLLPSTLPGVLLVVLVAVWARIVVGPVAGWVAAVLLVLWPEGIDLSQYVRFYALQGVAFVAASLLIYHALEDRASLLGRGALLAAALPLLALSAHLQLITLVGLAGVLLWVALAHLPGWLRASRLVWVGLGALVVATGAALASGIADATIAQLWLTYRWAPWPAVSDVFFYHRDLRDNYPTLWPLLPAAALVALAAFPRPAIFCLCLFATSVLVQSFGGLKSERYLYPTMPFFFVLWGAAAQAAWRPLRDAMTRTAQVAVGHFVPQAARGLGTAALVVSLVFLVAANAAIERAVNRAWGQPAHLLLEKRRWTWPAAPELTRPWLEAGAVVVTTEELLAIEWLGDFDLAFNKPRFSELAFAIGPGITPFTADPRNGRPSIGEVQDLGRVLRCEPVGILMTTTALASSGNLVPRIMLAAEAAGALTSIQSAGGLTLIGWRRETGAPATTGDACDSLPWQRSGRASERLLAGRSPPMRASIPRPLPPR